MPQPAWQWNEMQQVGTDYADVAEVERYERRMGEFRDLPAEDGAILAELALPAAATLLEIGTGTGHFARAAARAGHPVTAVDVSPTMLQYAETRAKAEGLSGITFQHAGFLSFTAEPKSFDAAVSVVALHHLPDVWKAVALERIHRALKPKGKFLLRDVVFSRGTAGYAAGFDAFVASVPEAMRPAVLGHVAKEFSTLDWIMEGLLERAGFRILTARPEQASLVQYVAQKVA